MDDKLLDTNVIVRFLNEEEKILNFVLNEKGICISSVSLGELIFGAEKSAKVKPNTERALNFFANFPVFLPTE